MLKYHLDEYLGSIEKNCSTHFMHYTYKTRNPGEAE